MRVVGSTCLPGPRILLSQSSKSIMSLTWHTALSSTPLGEGEEGGGAWGMKRVEGGRADGVFAVFSDGG